MTHVATPVPAPLQLAPAVETRPATLLASGTAPAARRSRLRRLASALAGAHRAAVPF